MGHTGKVTLVNGTPYDWILSYTHSHLMETWKWPVDIPAGQVASVTVEWDEGFFRKEHGDDGEATYTIKVPEKPVQFQIQAKSDPEVRVQVLMETLATDGCAAGATVDLGWIHNGICTFVVTGDEASGFWSTGSPAESWMSKNLSMLGPRTLKHLCLMGTHDAGMSHIHSHTAFADGDNAITQVNDIGGQLSFGSRYFDVRPVIADGMFYTGHYSFVKPLGKWEGANGQGIDDIVYQINEFTEKHAEFVIVNLSHDLDTDHDNKDYPSFAQDQWDTLFDKLLALNHLWVAPGDPTKVDLTNVVLNDLIGNGQAAVIVLVEPANAQLGEYAKKGFYKHESLIIYNKYSNTKNIDKMADDQLDKMDTQRPNPDATYFLLSWTLTQDYEEVALGVIGDPGSSIRTILELAVIAKPELYIRLLRRCSKKTYPNILYVDSLNDGNVAAMTLTINHLFGVA